MSWWVAGATLVSGVMGSNAAGDAADAQLQGSRESTAAQERMFNKQIELQEPWRAAGEGALNRLNYLLGLNTGGKTYEQYRQELLPQYTKSAPAGGVVGGVVGTVVGADRARDKDLTRAYDPGVFPSASNLSPQSSQSTASLIDEAALDAAIRARMSADSGAAKGADYGKYARDFGMSDFEADPGYAFRLSEGQKALERSATARGGLLSGTTLKNALRFGQDMGSQEYGNAYNRYQTNRSNQLQPLQSLAGVGQTSANTLTQAAGNFGAAQGENAINAGNARASSYVGQANAMNQGLSSYLNYNQNQNYINSLNRNRYAPNYGQYTPGSDAFVGPMPS